MRIVSSRPVLSWTQRAVRRVFTIVLAAACGILGARVAAAQVSPTGTLNGVVTDASGGVLPGVTVLAVNVATGVTQQTVTSESGDWRLAALPTGTYEVSFELDGFKKLVRSGVNVEAAVTHSVPVRLDIGGLTETIRVTADAALLNVTTRKRSFGDIFPSACVTPFASVGSFPCIDPDTSST